MPRKPIERYKEKVLEIVSMAKEPLNTNEIAKKAGLLWKTTNRHLKSLLEENIIQERKVGGKLYYSARGILVPSYRNIDDVCGEIEQRLRDMINSVKYNVPAIVMYFHLVHSAEYEAELKAGRYIVPYHSQPISKKWVTHVSEKRDVERNIWAIYNLFKTECKSVSFDQIPLEETGYGGDLNKRYVDLKVTVDYECMRHGDIVLDARLDEEMIYIDHVVNWHDCAHVEGVYDLALIQRTFINHIDRINWNEIKEDIKNIISKKIEEFKKEREQ